MFTILLYIRRCIRYDFIFYTHIYIRIIYFIRYTRKIFYYLNGRKRRARVLRVFGSARGGRAENKAPRQRFIGPQTLPRLAVFYRLARTRSNRRPIRMTRYGTKFIPIENLVSIAKKKRNIRNARGIVPRCSSYTDGRYIL